MPVFNKLRYQAGKLKNKRSVRNLSGVVAANLIATIISLLLSLFVPKLLPVEDYSYWQLYVFYMTYVGVLHFGIADGIYLRYGGQYYDKLDKFMIRSQFWVTVIIQLAVSIGVILFASFYFPESDKGFIITLVGVGIVLVNSRTFLQMLLQTTNRMVDFSKNLIYEKVIYVILVGFLLAFGIYDFHFFLYADLVAKAAMLLLLIKLCSGVLIGKTNFDKSVMFELWQNFSAGVKLMLANLAGILIVGVVRLIVEINWDIVTFGKLALILTATNLALIFVSAAGLVIYPILKRSPQSRLKEVYMDIRKIIVAAMLAFLLAYFPLRAILEFWLPQYADVFPYLALLFPLCVYEAKSQVLTNTYLKATRREGTLLFVNLSVLALSALTASVAALIFNSLTITILLITIMIGIKSLISELILGRVLKENLWKLNILEGVMVAVFIGLSWFIPQYAMVLYAVLVGVYLVIAKKGVVYAVRKQLLNS